jgi:hypothetical protein
MQCSTANRMLSGKMLWLCLFLLGLAIVAVSAVVIFVSTSPH